MLARRFNFLNIIPKFGKCNLSSVINTDILIADDATIPARLPGPRITLDLEIIGHYFNHLQFISRKEHINKLTPGAILRLFSMVKGPEDGKFVILMTKYYQKRGLDFSEQIASSFVKASIIGEKSKEAAELCAVYRYRIGAWLAPKSLDALVTDLCSKNEFDLVLTMMENLSRKGVVANISTFETLLELRSQSQHENPEDLDIRVTMTASKMLSPMNFEEISRKYSLVAPAAEESVAASGDDDDNTEEEAEDESGDSEDTEESECEDAEENAEANDEGDAVESVVDTDGDSISSDAPENTENAIEK